MNAKTVLPAVAMTAVSMVLTLAVVVMWLGTAMPWLVALVVGLGIDGGWLATLAYERRLAAQGDHSRTVTGVGWSFGLIATGVLIAHALTANQSVGAWLAVAWLPIAAKALWLVHGLWERTALTPDALDQIRDIQQDARDQAAVSRARLRAQAGTEETRLEAVTEAGARVARVQARTAERLSGAWSTLEAARQGDGTGRALASVTPESHWELPVWGPVEPVTATLEHDQVDTPAAVAPALTTGEAHDQETDPAVSTMTSQVTDPAAATWESESRKQVDWLFNGTAGPMPTRTVDATDKPLPTEVDTTPAPAERLDATAARAAIEAAWKNGLTIREAAVAATRSASYVGSIYAQLAKARGAAA